MHEEALSVTSVGDVRLLAERAHAGQTDKIGVPYIAHVHAVAAGLAPFGDELVMAGLLHDVVEDTGWTAEHLLAAGVPGPVVAIVEVVTNEDGVPYEDKIRRIARDPHATLVKIADNAHNSRADRAARLPAAKRERLAAKYRAARGELWPAARREDIEAIVRIVNPALLTELDDHGPYRSVNAAVVPSAPTAASTAVTSQNR
ncbi:HD domain-containing protein [Streptomyces sp. CAU 1734]|uniref:HD domain-containing protein n=1 Tax=Streptomyces sp. CAU 1734 TaxID=3140360 RepID=UPI003260F0F7